MTDFNDWKEAGAWGLVVYLVIFLTRTLTRLIFERRRNGKAPSDQEGGPDET
jgi:hypothetical protein